MRKLADWFKALFKMVKQFREEPPIKAWVRRGPKNYESLNIGRVSSYITLPKVVAKEIKPGDLPDEVILETFHLADYSDGYAMYEPTPTVHPMGEPKGETERGFGGNKG